MKVLLLTAYEAQRQNDWGTSQSPFQTFPLSGSTSKKLFDLSIKNVSELHNFHDLVPVRVEQVM